MRTKYENRRLLFTRGRRPGQAAGFSMLELIVIVAVIAILAMIAVPHLNAVMARQKMRGQAMDAMTMMRQARLDAAMTSKPVRVVVDCALDPCVMRSQVALYDQGTVSGWAERPGKRSVFDRQVRVARAAPVGPMPDGGATGDNFAWIIFTPGGQAFSNPRPFGLYFFHTAYRDSMSGWRLTVNNNSGRAALNSHTQ